MSPRIVFGTEDLISRGPGESLRLEEFPEGISFILVLDDDCDRADESSESLASSFSIAGGRVGDMGGGSSSLGVALV